MNVEPFLSQYYSFTRGFPSDAALLLRFLRKDVSGRVSDTCSEWRVGFLSPSRCGAVPVSGDVAHIARYQPQPKLVVISTGPE